MEHSLRRKRIKANFTLMAASIIWGVAFVAQKSGMEHVGPFLFNGMRFMMGAIVLIPVVWFMDKRSGTPWTKEVAKSTLKAGIICGTALFAASTLQQVGMVYSSASKTAFITTLYIVLVPVFGLFLKHKTGINTWVGVVLATIGLYLLCITESFSIAPGDGIILISSLIWALHIIFIDHYAKHIDPVKLNLVQVLMCSILSFVLAGFFETIELSGIKDGMGAMFFAGVLSVGVGFTFQVIGQRNSTPAVASIILSFESVFGALAGWFFLKEILTTRELLGCVLMFCAIIIAQLPYKSIKRSSLQNNSQKE